jgi:hypothetical protein
MPIFDEVVAPYWSVGAANVIKRKIKEEECYEDQLREAFAARMPELDPNYKNI